MADSIRPSREAFEAMYERAYRTWAELYEDAADNTITQNQFPGPCSAFPNHPYFPPGLAVDTSFSNTATVKGKSLWTTTRAPCQLSPFQDEVVFDVAASCPIAIAFVSDPPETIFMPNCFGTESNHVTILILAWAYILSARWAELLNGAQTPKYSSHQARLYVGDRMEHGDESAVIDVGDVDQDAARWWTAVLAPESGWEASLRRDTDALLYSPWSIKTLPGPAFVVTGNIHAQPPLSYHRPASFSTAVRYLSDYCHRHGISDQSDAALAAALLVPTARFNNRRIKLAMPKIPRQATTRTKNQTGPTPRFWDSDPHQLDRLLTLSCNSRGVKAILNSIFFESDVACNICGAWLQGSFAFLDSDKVRTSPGALLRTFINRDPGLGFLWLGAFITGVAARCIQEARGGWWKVDLNAAAWTETHMSFIQEPVPQAPSNASHISRADELRLMYFCHEPHHATPPLFPFAPFGSTAMDDAGLEVRQHTQCSAAHQLEYVGFIWDCQSGVKIKQGGEGTPLRITNAIRAKNGQAPMDSSNGVSVDYDHLEFEDDDVSEMVTRNVFTWLRGEDGFPLAERAIRKHEWIENLDSDDDSPIEGDVHSTVGRNLGGWLLRQATKRSNSI